MNIALEKTEEYVDGVKRRTYGDAFVRGNNGLFSSFVCLVLVGSSSDFNKTVMYISADS